MNRLYFRRFALSTTCLLICAVFRFETPVSVRVSAQTGNAGVLVDFRAFADDGKPVADLKAEDVSIKVDGKERAVTSLRFVQNAARPAARVPPPFATNSGAEIARDLIVLVDDESIAPGRENGIRDAAARLLAALGPGDRVALFGVRPGGLNVPLGEPSRVGDALASMVGQLGNQELTCRTSLVLQRTASILSARGSNPAIVVFFSSGLASPESGMRPVLGIGGKLCEVRATDFDEVAKAAAVSRVSFFPVLVMDGSGKTDSSDYAGGVEHLAAIVGADRFRMSGTVDPVVTRILRDMSQYYIASIDVDPGERTDTPRRLEVRAKRSGVKVQAKSQMVAGKAAAAAGAPRDMLRSPSTYRDLTLRVAAYPSRGADEKAGVKVMAFFEPIEPTAKLSAAAIGFYDDKGTLKAQWTAQPAELARSPVPAAVVVPAGTYRVRLAATDTNGRSGTTDFDLQAQLKPLGTFRTSALMLGVPQNGAFSPRLQFGADQAAVGVLEVYGVTKGAAVAVRLELADSEQSVPLANATTNIAQGPGDDARTAFGGFAISGLQPGDYLLRAIVTVDGKEAGRATQTLRKVQP